MKPEDFKRILQNRLDHSTQILLQKEKEYGSNDDRFQNFDDMAKADQISKEQALWGTLLKHYISVRDMVKNPKIYHKAYISEKIGDLVNLSILLEGILLERNDKISQKNLKENALK